uniref:Uncharacterized protein n=1 Tax=Aegilops tauschii subsp. strangulata TaxID=200361 RepID=A0A453N4Y2_AEGTS
IIQLYFSVYKGETSQLLTSYTYLPQTTKCN